MPDYTEDNTEELLIDGSGKVAGELKMTSQLAEGLVHEISNPLAFLQANLQSLKDDVQELTKTWQLIAQLQDAQVRGEMSAVHQYLQRLDECEDPHELLAEADSLITDNLEGTRRIQEVVGVLRQLSTPAAQWSTVRCNIKSVLTDWLTRPTEASEVRTRVTLGKMEEVVPARIAERDLQITLSNMLLFLQTLTERKGTRDSRPIVVRTREQDGFPALEFAHPTLRKADLDLERMQNPRVEPDPKTGQVMRLTFGLTIARMLLARTGGEIQIEEQKDGGATLLIVMQPVY